MRFYTNQHRYYCGIDLHARTMYVCILDPEGQILLHRNMPCCPGSVPQGHCSLPRRHRRLPSSACSPGTGSPTSVHNRSIPFVLGHALYMKAIHGGKAKNDKIDAHKIAVLLRGGMLPHGLRLSRPRCGPPATCSAAACT